MKTESKHTPGPWSVGDKAHDIKRGSQWEVTVFADEAPSGDKIPGAGTATSREQARANARLIAAAPELLEAAKIVMGFNTCYTNKLIDCGQCGFCKLKNAISKAEGRE